MYSFIPSWYEGTGEWHAHIAPWYQKAQSYEFDDTVNQLRMFRDAGEETELLCLAFFSESSQVSAQAESLSDCLLVGF